MQNKIKSKSMVRSSRENRSFSQSASLFFNSLPSVVFVALFVLFLKVGVLGFGRSAWAAELNVGSGQTYSTIASAITASGSGDTIVIHEGTYNEYNLEPKSNTILKQADGEAKPLIDGQQDVCSKNSIFDMNNVDIVVFDGLIVTGGGTDLRGNWFIGYSGACNNITIKNCETYITGDGYDSCPTADNPSIIMLSNCNTCTIKDTYVYGINILGQSKEVCGIKVWDGSHSLTIENCEIYDLTGKSIGNKHGGPNQSMTIRYNFLHDCKEAIHTNSDYSTITHNLIVNCRYGVRTYYNVAQEGGSYSTYTHNTFYGASFVSKESEYDELFDVTIRDNIFFDYGTVGERRAITIGAYDSSPYDCNFTCDHNLFYESDTSIIANRFGMHYTFFRWQGIGHGTGSLNSAPTFVGGGSPSASADFALAGGSAGKNAASDGTDVGADISLVGIQSGPDTIPPSRSNPQPTGTVTSGTTQTIISLDTNETATCKYSETAGIDYDSMTLQLSSGQANTHTATVSNLSDGNSYIYYIRCQDTATPPNQNTDDFEISFSVANASSDTTPPVRSNAFPQGELDADTISQDISLSTDEDATCKYSMTQSASYADMTEFLNTTGTNHTTEITGLENGRTYTYYVKCKDELDNTNPDDFAITFSVASTQVTNNNTSTSGGGGSCFIATAAYGTPMAEEVKILSRFRDQHLLNNNYGKTFVKMYYKYSPRVADYIRHRVWARSVVRLILRPLVKITK